MNIYGTGEDAARGDIHQIQQKIASQLHQIVPTMRNMDELLQWLAYVLTRYLGIRIAQFWTSQRRDQMTQTMVQLRAMVQQDGTFPEKLVVNEHVGTLVQRLVQEQQGFQYHPVEQLFSQYPSMLLKRYGLYYCIEGCINVDAITAPRQEGVYGFEHTQHPFVMALLFFVRHTPQRDLISVLGVILDQAVVAAGGHGLLLSKGQSGNHTFASAPVAPMHQPEAPPPLTDLIPRKKQDANLMLSTNPFSSQAIISDKKARHLYQMIDGSTTVAGLSHATGMTIQEVIKALKFLLNQQRIEFYTAQGKHIDPTF